MRLRRRKRRQTVNVVMRNITKAVVVSVWSNKSNSRENTVMASSDDESRGQEVGDSH